jgi:hypothetical protein
VVNLNEEKVNPKTKECEGNGEYKWKAAKLESKDEVADGYGSETEEETPHEYIGEFVDYIPHGEGKETFPNGDDYSGNYEFGLRDG